MISPAYVYESIILKLYEFQCVCMAAGCNGAIPFPFHDQVGLVTYSEHAAIQFDLNDYHTQQLVEAALDKVWLVAEGRGI